MSAASSVPDYLDALTSSDLDRARSLLTDDFSFRGPGMDAAVDRETFLREFATKYEHGRGARVLRQVVNNTGDVCSLYELDAKTPSGYATLLMTEWDTVRDGRVASARLVFDTAQGTQLHAR